VAEDEPPEILAENPVTNVSGRKSWRITVSCCHTSFIHCGTRRQYTHTPDRQQVTVGSIRSEIQISGVDRLAEVVVALVDRQPGIG